MSSTSTPFQTGRTEEIRLDVRDLAGDPVLGATGVLIRIQRASDGQFFDFDDSTFKAAAWTERDTALTQVDAVLLAGIYELPGGFDSATVTNISKDDTYIVFPVKGAAVDTEDAVMPAPGEFKVGFFADSVGLTATVSATIGSSVPDTLELMAWLVRDADVVTAGLVSATIELQDAFGVTVVPAAAMAGPTAVGVFRRSVPNVTLPVATNFVAIVTIVDSVGTYTSLTATPTVG